MIDGSAYYFPIPGKTLDGRAVLNLATTFDGPFSGTFHRLVPIENAPGKLRMELAETTMPGIDHLDYLSGLAGEQHDFWCRTNHLSYRFAFNDQQPNISIFWTQNFLAGNKRKLTDLNHLLYTVAQHSQAACMVRIADVFS